jgi:ParB-like nuclease domain
MGWRKQYKVHPAADVFPMMSDEELAKLSEDIRAHGLKNPIVLFSEWDGPEPGEGNIWLIDGRNRLEATERAGVQLDPRLIERVFCGDPVTWIITLNIHRRHLTKQQQAELIVTAHEAAAKLVQVEPVCTKGGRGKKNPTKTPS